jgi:ribosomal protein L11 methylase PrmA
VTLFEGSSELLEGPFDLMIANMGNAPMILDVVPTALSQLRPGGTLIVGGIYAYQEFSLENRKQLVLDGLAALGLEFMESLQFKKCVALSLKYRS